jgi:electron-transferring-flavoprotein dehydrogenase
MPKIDYPKYDNVITFDKTSSVYLTGTNHADNQPVHLKLKDPKFTN